MRVSNNKDILNKIMCNKFETMIGSLETNHLKTCATYVYSQKEMPNDTDAKAYLNGQMYCVQEFLMATWLLRSNCINFELCFLIMEDGEGYGVTSNFLSHRYCNTDGKNLEVIFTREELRRIRKIHTNRFGIKEEQLPFPDIQFTKDNSRIGRALTWINAARGSPINSIRVANFCTAFETLFSTTQNEIAHQLSERIAIFLHPEKQERLETYQSLKRAYELRSRIIHGSTTSESVMKNPVVIASQCEDFARKIISKIIENDSIFEMFNKSNDSLSTDLLNMVLTGHSID